MIRLFFSNRSVGLLFLPLIQAGFICLNFLYPYHLPEETANFGFWGTFLKQDTLYSQIVAPLLVFLNGILLNIIFNRNDFFEKNTYIVSLIYVLFSSYFHNFYFLNGFSAAQFFIVLSLFQLVRLNQNEDGRRLVFNAALFLGIACTFYPLLILAFPFLFWIIWVIRPFVFRESLLTIVGFIIPFIYAGIYNFVLQRRFNSEEFSSSSFEFKIIDMGVLLFFTFLFFLPGIPGILKKFQKSSIRLKKLFRMISLLLMFSIFLLLLEFLAFKKSEPLAMLFIPLSFFLPYSFGDKEPKAFTTFLFYLVLLFSILKFFIDWNVLAAYLS